MSSPTLTFTTPGASPIVKVLARITRKLHEAENRWYIGLEDYGPVKIPMRGRHFIAEQDAAKTLHDFEVGDTAVVTMRKGVDGERWILHGIRAD